MTIEVRRVLRRLVALGVALEMGHVAAGAIIVTDAAFEGSRFLAEQLSLDAEHNVPTITSVGLLLLAALLTFVAARGDEDDDRARARGWRVLGVLLVLFALSEGAEIHEFLTGQLLEWIGPIGELLFAAAAIAVVGGVGVTMYRLGRRLPRWVLHRLALAAATYLLGALVIEQLTIALPLDPLVPDWAYMISVALEEGLELAGIIILIVALLEWLGARPQPLPVAIVSARGVSAPAAPPMDGVV